MPFNPELSDRNIQALPDHGAFVAEMNKEKDEAAKILKPWKDKVVKYSELYQMVQSNKHYEGLANIFVPEILRAVETVVSNLQKVTFSSDPWFEFAGREETDIKSAIAETELIKYQLEENNFKVRAADSFRQLAIAGLTVRKIGWDYEMVMKKQKALNAQGIPEVISVPETTRDTWTFDSVDLIGFLISDINTAYHDITRARWIGEESFNDPHFVQERMKRGYLSKVYKDKIAAMKTADSDASQLLDRRNRGAGFSNVNDSKKIHLFERWGLLRADLVHDAAELSELGLEPDDMVETVVIIANKSYVVKLEANPYFHNRKPYVSCPYVPLEFQFSGMGVAQIAEKLQEELNDTRNQTMDNKTLILNNMWLKGKGSGISNKSLRVRPLGIIETNDMNALKPLAPPILTGVGVNIEGIVKEDIRQATGASSNLQGIAQSGVSTATESSLINKESYSRLLAVGEMYGQLVLKPTLLMAESLNYQYYDHTKVIKIIGPLGVKFKKLEPNELIGNKDVTIHLAVDLNDSPDVKRQQLLQFLTIIQNIPPEMYSFYWKFMDKVYQSFFPGKNLEDVFPAPPGLEELLSSVEEMELVVAEYTAIVPKPRQDIVQHIEELKHIFAETAHGLSEKSFGIATNLIMAYEALRHEMEVQFEQQKAAQEAANGPQEKGGTKAGGGKMPNSSQHTQTKRDTNSSLRKNIGV